MTPKPRATEGGGRPDRAAAFAVLGSAKRAADRRRRADVEYREAVAVAVDGLESAGDRQAFATVAVALGVSRQAVRELVGRVREDRESVDREVT